MKRVASGVVKIVLSVAVVLVVFSAIVVGIARELVDEIDDFQPQLVEYFNQESGFNLQVESIEGRWKGLTPRIKLYNVLLRSDPKFPQGFQAQSVNLEILILDTLLELNLRFRLHVHGAQAKLIYKEGGFTLEGFEFSSAKKTDESEDNAVVDFLMAQRKILITDSVTEIEGLYEQPVQVSIKQMQFESGHRRRYFLGHITANGPSQISMQIRGKMNGSFFKKGSAQGDLYAKIDNADWFPWIPRDKRGVSQAQVVSLKGGGEFWLKLDQGLITETTSDFSINDIKLHSDNEIQPPVIERLNGLANWSRQGDGVWSLVLQNLDMETPDFIWRPELLQLHSKEKSSNGTRYQLFADDLKIAPWTNYFLAIQKRDSALFQVIKKTRPAGNIRNLFLEFNWLDETISDYRFAIELKQIQNRSWKFIPGFHDLEISAWGKKDLILFQLDEDYLELTYPRIFRDQLTLNKLQAKLLLRLSDQGVFLQSDAIQAVTDDVQAVTQLSLDIPKDKNDSPFLQLQSTLRNANGEHTSKYLPAGVLSDSLLTWLDEAIVDGHLLRGDLLFHGPTKKLQDEHFGVMLGFTAEDGILQFLPDWKEPIKNGVVDVLVNGGEVIAQATEGTYFEQHLQQGMVYTPKITPVIRPELNIQAVTKGKAATGINVLKQTPLAGMIGEFVQDMDARGDLAVDLSLKIPLDKSTVEDMQANADVTVDNGWYRLHSQNLEIDNLAGKVNFNLDSGLSASGVTGSLFDGKIVGEIQTKQLKQGQEIQLNFSGDASLDLIKQWKPISLLNIVDGNLDYQFALHIAPSALLPERRSFFKVTSDLVGASVDLPEPYHKETEATNPFELKMTIDSLPSQLHLRYGELLQVAYQSVDGKLQKGSVHLGVGNAQLPEEDKLTIKGNILSFDDSVWKPVVEKLMSAAKQNNEPVDENIPFLIDDSDINVHQLTLGGVRFGSTDLSVRRKQNGWMLAASNDTLRGNAVLPSYLIEGTGLRSSGAEPVVVDLEYINLPKSTEVANDELWQPMDLSPQEMPAVEITIGNFTYGDGKFGLWNIHATPSASGMDIVLLQAAMNGVNLNGTGTWYEHANGKRHTKLLADVNASNAADIMAVWGVEPVITSKKAIANLNVTWPGAPVEFALKRASGEMHGELKNGTFLNVSSNAAGKLWGALNFETLLRRMELNFDDIKESELVYDKVEGDFKLKQGILDIEKVELDSPAIEMRANGNIDLNQEQLNVNLDVTVPIARNLILPAAVIGGVPAMATAFVVEKVFGSQFDKLTTIKYGVTGAFDDPKFEVKDSFSIIPKQVGEAVVKNDKPAKSETPPQETPKPVAPIMQQKTESTP